MVRVACLILLAVGACGDPELDGGAPVAGRTDLPASGAAGPPTSDVSYDAEASARCRSLIQRSGIEAISSCPSGSDDPGTLVLPDRPGCLRDSYLATALAYCWRSECLTRQGPADEPRARDEAGWALDMLADAASLCRQADDSCTMTPLLPCP
jgi:hypothetical protein